jgi:hypothetical protein
MHFKGAFVVETKISILDDDSWPVGTLYRPFSGPRVLRERPPLITIRIDPLECIIHNKNTNV